MVVDCWVNALTADAARRLLGTKGFGAIEGFFGADVQGGTTTGALVGEMDRLGVDRAVLTAGLSTVDEPTLEAVAGAPDRLWLALMADDPHRPTRQVRALRSRAADGVLDMVRVSPLVHQLPLNDARYYPVYAACEELGLPVSVNVGIPGPRVRSRCQDPVLLEDLLIDFPDLVVIGAHMGHPYEALLVQYMLKWPNLHLMSSAYLATYMDPALVRFMGSRRGRGRVLFASDHPFLPMERALAAARALPLEPEALDEYLGGGAARLLG